MREKEDRKCKVIIGLQRILLTVNGPHHAMTQRFLDAGGSVATRVTHGWTQDSKGQSCCYVLQVKKGET